MIEMTLAQVAEAIGASAPADASGQLLVTSVEFDTRRLTPGALFVALVGENVDGHDLAAAARAAGAVAVLGSRELPADAGLPVLRVSAPDGVAATDPDATTDPNAAVLTALARLAHASVTALVVGHDLQVIGVTGSSGKTSTKDLIAAVLAASGEPVVAPPESFNNELGHPYTALRATPQTRYLVLELSARGRGHIAELARVAPPRIGAVLNVGSAHLGEFGSVDGIAEAKSELVQALPAASVLPGRGGVAILNADDERVAAMADRTSAEVVLVGQDASASVRAEDVTADDADRAIFTLVTPEGAAPVRLSVVGAHQIGNALAAAAVGRAVGLPIAQIAEALSAAGPASKWRMDVTELANGVLLVNDAYNANPHSTKAALRSLAKMKRTRPGRAWAVLGEMGELGDEAIAAHDEVGRLVVRLGIDQLIVVGAEGPGRSALARALHLGAHLEGSWGGESLPVSDVDEAVAVLIEEITEGDVVLVKASRSVGLERVAIALIDRIGTSVAEPTGASAVRTGGVGA